MKKFKKTKALKILNIVLIATVIIMLLQSILYAAEPQIIDQIDTASETEEEMDETFYGAGGGIDGVVGMLTLFLRIPFLLLAMAVQGILEVIGRLGGNEIQGFLTPDDLFYNRVALTDINFFDFNVGGEMKTIRTNVATWYYILRIFAIIILLVVLIYIGIRMAISTVASEQAQYKRMLMDWAVSFALIFFLGYIILFTIEANKAFLEMLETTVNNKIGKGVAKELILTTIIGRASASWTALLCYWMLVGITMAFLFSYIKRMLTIGFLIIISPLITVTYSIDKVKDSKAQALNTWLKEFMLTVLIQPFHCIIYTVFVSSTLEMLNRNHSLGAMVLSLMCMSFIWQAEKIVKKIFGFDAASTSLGETIASTALVKEIGNAATNVAKSAGKVAGSTQFGKNVSQRINSNPTLSSIKNTVNNSNSAMAKLGNEVIKQGAAMTFGASMAAFEKGANTSANAAHVGFTAYNSSLKTFNDLEERDGSAKNIDKAQKDIERYADLAAKNNASYQNFRTDNSSRDDLKRSCEQLIGYNMDQLQANIQDCLRELMRNDPTEYNLTTPQGIANLKRIQDAALNMATDFNDPTTNPNYNATTHPTWTQEEKDVITAIQTRNLAQAVQDLGKQSEARGRDAATEVKNFIDTLT